jgi:hypothetical protein
MVKFKKVCRNFSVQGRAYFVLLLVVAHKIQWFLNQAARTLTHTVEFYICFLVIYTNDNNMIFTGTFILLFCFVYQPSCSGRSGGRASVHAGCPCGQAASQA